MNIMMRVFEINSIRDIILMMIKNVLSEEFHIAQVVESP